MKTLAALFFASTLVAPLFAAETYTLVFDRKSKAGQRFTLEATAAFEENNSLTVNGTPARNEKKSGTWKVTGELEILAVHESGQPRDSVLKVTKSEATENGQAATPFQAGDKIEVTRGDARAVIKVQGQTATPLQVKLVDTLSLVSSGNEPKDDKVFSPGRPVKAGEEWPVNAEVAAADSAIQKIGEFTPADIKGTVRCVEPVTHGGMPCVKVRAGMKMSSTRGTLPELPPQIKVRSIDMVMTGEADLPINPQASRPLDTMEMTFAVDAGGTVERDGAKQTLEMRSHNRRMKSVQLTPTFTPVK